ncbi:hypothetical protein [Mediterraneibacter hominis]
MDVWGQRHLRNLKQHHKILCYNLLTPASFILSSLM